MKKIIPFLALVFFTSTLAFCSSKKVTTDSLKTQKNQESKLISENKIYKQNKNHELVEVLTSKYLVARGSYSVAFPVKEGQKYSETQEEKFFEYKVLTTEKIICEIPKDLQNISDGELTEMVTLNQNFFVFLFDFNNDFNLLSAPVYQKSYFFIPGQNRFSYQFEKDRIGTIILNMTMVFILFLVFYMYFMKTISRKLFSSGIMSFLVLIFFVFSFIFLYLYVQLSFTTYKNETPAIFYWKSWINLINFGAIIFYYWLFGKISEIKK